PAHAPNRYVSHPPVNPRPVLGCLLGQKNKSPPAFSTAHVAAGCKHAQRHFSNLAASRDLKSVHQSAPTPHPARRDVGKSDHTRVATSLAGRACRTLHLLPYPATTRSRDQSPRA